MRCDGWLLCFCYLRMSVNLCLLADMHLFVMNTRHMSAPYRMSLLSMCAAKIRVYLVVFSMELCLSHQLIYRCYIWCPKPLHPFLLWTWYRYFLFLTLSFESAPSMACILWKCGLVTNFMHSYSFFFMFCDKNYMTLNFKINCTPVLIEYCLAPFQPLHLLNLKP